VAEPTTETPGTAPLANYGQPTVVVEGGEEAVPEVRESPDGPWIEYPEGQVTFPGDPMVTCPTDPLVPYYPYAYQPVGPVRRFLQNACCNYCAAQGCREVYGEFLYVRPRNAEVAYGVAIDGPITTPPMDPPIQIGPVGIVDPDYEPAFRIGFSRMLDNCSSIGGAYTRYESDTYNHISTTVPNVIRSLVSHPSSSSASTDYLDGSANSGIDFDLIDLEFRNVLFCRNRTVVNSLLGARYARMDQTFNATFVDLGTEAVNSRVDFDGAGLRIGLEGERHGQCWPVVFYGRSTASFVAGEFRTSYHQGQSFDQTVVDTGWRAGRIVTILDFELGVGWASPGGRLHLTAGYMVSAWMNAVKTADWIQAVQSNSFTGMGDTLTFDGLVLRADVNF
jgi:hypothetical protein